MRIAQSLAAAGDPPTILFADEFCATLDRLTQPVRDAHDRASRGFNPAAPSDLALFAAVLRGEHTLQGFRNRDVRTHLFGANAATDRRRI